MDAKPQRPRAPTRVRDENMPLSHVGPMKTLHQRTKSTSALSTLLKNGIKANPQRRAFADVSNTARTFQPAQDDMVLSQKGTYDAYPTKQTLQPLKEIPDNYQLVSKQPALLRPAQRILQTIPQKAAPAAPVNTVVSAIPKHVVTEPACEVANIRKVLHKKQTTIFKETSLVAEFDSAPASLQTQIKSTTSIAPVHQVLEIPREKQAPTIPESAAIAAPSISSNAQRAEFSEPCFSPDMLESVNHVLANSEQLHVLDKELPAVPSHHVSSEVLEQVQSRSSESEMYLPALESQVRPLDPAVDEVKAPESAIEAQEYWEEDDEEYYDAEGYTTGRSLRSRGDNTTGGLTTVIEPRVTARVMKELEEANAYVVETRTEEDIEDEAWDTSMVAEYGEEIFEYMRKLENKMRPNEHYMDNQAEIQWSMRAVLMDWLIQVHARFQLLPETLFLAVNYVDRFLSCKIVSLGKLQLVGATAIFVAAKYEEINCPSVQEIVYMVDGGYTVDEILKAERFMLSMLQFELGWPGPMSFLRRISKADEYDLETRTLAKYLLEVMIMDERFVACAPSFAAAGAHCLARLLLRKGDWGHEHVHYSQYTYWQLYDLVNKVVECCQNPSKHHSAVFEKYKEKKYKKASLYVETEIQRGFRLPPRVPQREQRDSSSWHSTLWKRS